MENKTRMMMLRRNSRATLLSKAQDCRRLICQYPPEDERAVRSHEILSSIKNELRKREQHGRRTGI